MEFLKVEHLDGGTFASGPCLGIFDDLREGGRLRFQLPNGVATAQSATDSQRSSWNHRKLGKFFI